MLKLKLLTIKQRIVFLFGLICTILLATGGLFFFSLQSIEYINKEQQSHALVELELAEEIIDNIELQQNQVFCYLLTFDEERADSYEQVIRSLHESIGKQLASFRDQNFIDPGEETRSFDIIWKVRVPYEKTTTALLALKRANAPREVLNAALLSQLKNYEVYRAAMGDVLKEAQEEAHEVAKVTNAVIFKTKVIGNILIGVAIVIIVGTAFMLLGVVRKLSEDNKNLEAEVGERKRAEMQLIKMHKDLLNSSRVAGMAEIATNVLHNVGNVLNSVNVSANLVSEFLKRSHVANFSKAMTLIKEHEGDLNTFFNSDPKGREVLDYLSQLGEHLITTHEGMFRELGLLQKNIEHIKDIVSMQQSYAQRSGMTEVINVKELMEDSLRMNVGALARHQVEVIRDYEEVSAISVDKNKVLQILINLVRNAKYACDECKNPDKKMILGIHRKNEKIQLSVTDNGVGIAPENLERIFSHGFTTRQGGHGFGLHGGSIAAKEMGGVLTAYSDGRNKGACFVLELPMEPPKFT